jgi:hypothetical protein
MTPKMRKKILDFMKTHRVMTIATMAIVKVMPKVFFVLDYTQGFGHTDLVRA